MLSLYFDDRFEDHETPTDHPECPERARAVVGGLSRLGFEVRRREGAHAGDVADLERVHDAAYVAAVRDAAAAGGGALDADTWISPASWEVALLASGTVVHATDVVLGEGEPPAFAVVRPPGHHARPSRGMGFCLFNNVAIAAAKAREVHGLSKVAVLDFDVHHGNGTQDAFWRDPSVLYVSLHRDRFYPGTGGADETGAAEGKGATLNVPLRFGTKPSAYREAFSRAMDRITSFQPELLLVSAGFDAYDDDPIGGLGLRPEDFRWIGAELRSVADATCKGRLVSALEGGYAIDALGDLVGEYCHGVAGVD